MSERTIQQLVARLNSSDPDFDDCTDAAIILLRQHAEIERLKSDAERVNTYAKNLAIALHRKNFSHITKWEPLPDTLGLITQIDNMLCWTGDDVAQLTAERETIISDFLKRIGQYVTNDASREAAIAAAVAAEREACAAACRRRSESSGIYGSASAGALQCERDIMARGKDDAEAQVVTWLETLNSVDALIEQARIAEREACAVVCDGLESLLPGTKTGNMLQWAAYQIRARSAT